jgi:hypothetical protein
MFTTIEMRVRALVGSIALMAPLALWAQSLADQLPEWARPKWAAVTQSRGLEIAARMNPFVWRGDFDGDGRQDVAVFVRATQSKKEGIAFLFRGATPTVVVGAGTELGNGGDDFSWLDLWTVVERPGADALLVEKESSASGLIEIKNSKAVWRQQGD